MLAKRSVHDRSNRVHHVRRGKVKAGGQLRRAGALLVSLRAHDRVADVAQLQSRVGVDRVVDAAVIGREAAEQLRVRGVDDRIDFERRDVALPEIAVRTHGRQIAKPRHALLARRFL